LDFVERGEYPMNNKHIYKLRVTFCMGFILFSIIATPLFPSYATKVKAEPHTSRVLFYDDFSNGNADNWVVNGPGSWYVQNYEYIVDMGTGSSKQSISLAGDINWTDYIFEVDLRGDAGTDKLIAIRYSNNGDFYWLNLRGPWGSGVLFGKAIGNNTGPVLASGSYDIENGVWYHVKVIVQGNRIRAFIDQNLVIDYIDNNSALMQGRIGLMGYTGAYGSCAIHYDNVIVQAIADWTILHYLAADNDLDTIYTYLYEDISRATISPSVDLAVFYDGRYSQARYISFSNSSFSDPVWKGELNTGDPQTLIDFMFWAKTYLPAFHYALVISDHGHGLNGSAWDDTSSGDYLTPTEIRQALLANGKLDVLYMNTCLNATLDFGYQLRSLADYMVASESITWGPVLQSDYLSRIQVGTTPEELAIIMAENYESQWRKTVTPSTISVVRLSNVDQVASNAHTLAARQYVKSCVLSRGGRYPLPARIFA
jgi:hypothetical protein